MITRKELLRSTHRLMLVQGRIREVLAMCGAKIGSYAYDDISSQCVTVTRIMQDAWSELSAAMYYTDNERRSEHHKRFNARLEDIKKRVSVIEGCVSRVR